MIFSNDRLELRRYFFNVWQKHQEKQLLDPLDQQILKVIFDHPEYHFIFNQPDKYIDHDFSIDNPFLHMSLHLSIREQIQTNRPKGILEVYNHLLEKNQGNWMQTEHQMMECLNEMLWQAQRDQQFPDEEIYLSLLKSLREHRPEY